MPHPARPGGDDRGSSRARPLLAHSLARARTRDWHSSPPRLAYERARERTNVREWRPRRCQSRERRAESRIGGVPGIGGRGVSPAGHHAVVIRTAHVKRRLIHGDSLRRTRLASGFDHRPLPRGYVRQRARTMPPPPPPPPSSSLTCPVCAKTKKKRGSSIVARWTARCHAAGQRRSEEVVPSARIAT